MATVKGSWLCSVSGVVVPPRTVFVSGVQAIFGSSLYSFGVLDDVTEAEGQNISQLIAVNGSNLTPGSTNYRTVTMVNSRKFARATASAGRSYQWASSSVPKYMFGVLNIPSLPWANSGYVLCPSGYTVPFLQCSSGTSNWVSSGTVEKNAVVTNVASTGLALYSGELASNANASLQVGGLGSGFPSFDALLDIGCWGACTSIPTALQKSQLLALARAYYGF